MLFGGSIKSAGSVIWREKGKMYAFKMMLSGANVLILDEPTNHLDLESITAVNNGLINFPGTIFIYFS